MKNAKYFREQMLFHLADTLKKPRKSASPKDWYAAFAMTLNELMANMADDTEAKILNGKNAFACYLSMEYLLGRLAKQTLLNAGIEETFRKAFKSLGLDMDKIVGLDVSTQLGNGGLGRLAACFFDSLATMKMPAFGYGLFYRCGIYRQEIVRGRQVEKPDLWQGPHNAAIRRRADIAYDVKFGGRLDHEDDIEKMRWREGENVCAAAADAMLAGYGGGATLTLRLWEAERVDRGAPDIWKPIRNITDFLYPPDTTAEGKRLRLRQEQVLVSASMQDMFARFRKTGIAPSKIEKYVHVQLNDTHPALAIPEIIRILMQDYHFGYEAAYKKTYKICAYTNHTLMAEALEKIGIGLFRRELPYHFAIIERINRDFLAAAARKTSYPKLREIEIVDYRGGHVHTGRLCIAATHKVNGVAALHSKLLRKKEFPLFAKLFPGKFINETNGITQRRWLLQANPALAALITSAIGDGWIRDLGRLRRLLKYRDDDDFLNLLSKIREENKKSLFDWLSRETGMKLDSGFMLDAQVKRIHEYKRQLLNILQVIHRYNLICDGKTEGLWPKVCLFAGKAPPTYETAKDILSLIIDVANVVNGDRRCRGWLRVVFVPNYNIDIAEKIARAADVSEQISTAGKEASGTGNMKFALNGAITIGTMDGANVEIADAVGSKNIVTFGLSARQAYRMREKRYDMRQWLGRSPEMRRIIAQLRGGFFSCGDRSRHRLTLDALFGDNDQYMILPDFAPYLAAQAKIDAMYADRRAWAQKSLSNIAMSGFFSSDRAIRGYARDIWKIKEIKE
ncbi:MAG: glycogen/starch/alpha-glucan family phosphorylase [Rickettsiales bacterium]|jgi:starch phosphorylase|nr:glycogen/starch/alpha-glucan family phosphorylase [Rickettsiales bacterium]